MTDTTTTTPQPAASTLPPGGLDATETVIQSLGHIYVGPVGTAFPTGYTEPQSPWEEIGHTSTDGPRPSGFTRDAERMFSWQSPNSPIRSVPQAAEPQFLIDLLQVNALTLTLYFGGGTYTAGTAGAPDVYSPPLYDPEERALIIDWWDGSTQYRWCVKRVVPIAGGDITLESGALAVFPVRFDMLAAADGSEPFELRVPAAA